MSKILATSISSRQSLSSPGLLSTFELMCDEAYSLFIKIRNLFSKSVLDKDGACVIYCLGLMSLKGFAFLIKCIYLGWVTWIVNFVSFFFTLFLSLSLCISPPLLLERLMVMQVYSNQSLRHSHFIRNQVALAFDKFVVVQQHYGISILVVGSYSTCCMLIEWM